MIQYVLLHAFNAFVKFKLETEFIMAASLAETSVSHLPIPSLGIKRSKKTIAELAPCFTPFGKEKVYAEGSVFELPTEGSRDVGVLAILKRSPDQQRITAINKILVVPEPSGDEVWVVPEQPGREDRSKRFRYTADGGIEISLFNGSFLQVEYSLETGELKHYASADHDQEIPSALPKKELSAVLQTMDSLIQKTPLELSTMQSLVNFPRDHKLEGF